MRYSVQLSTPGSAAPADTPNMRLGNDPGRGDDRQRHEAVGVSAVNYKVCACVPI